VSAVGRVEEWMNKLSKSTHYRRHQEALVLQQHIDFLRDGNSLQIYRPAFQNTKSNKEQDEIQGEEEEENMKKEEDPIL
jgi:hypothetical protein